MRRRRAIAAGPLRCAIRARSEALLSLPWPTVPISAWCMHFGLGNASESVYTTAPACTHACCIRGPTLICKIVKLERPQEETGDLRHWL